MDRQQSAPMGIGRFTRETRPADSIPAPVRALVAKRLAELHPLHVEYNHLLDYRRMLDATRGGEVARRTTAAPRARHGAARELILAALRSGTAQTEEVLAEGTGVQPATLTYNLRRLTRLGTIEPVELEDGAGYRLAGGQGATKADA